MDRGDGIRFALCGPLSISAAYAIVTIPLPVLAGIQTDFSPPFKQAIASTAYDNAVKLAWQSSRFWETDDHNYGGISFVKGETTLLWYPSDRFQIRTGNCSIQWPWPVRFRRPSKFFEDALAANHLGVMTLGDITAIRGGLPVMVDGKALGAIGVSGGDPGQDEQCAEAGLAALH